ncbi:MAG: pyrimidine 5'-nucleotidase, partial [Rhizobium sp.]
MNQPKTLPAPADFDTVRDWVFDLDNTLYPHSVDLFSQIDTNMTSYVAALLDTDRVTAKKLQKQYYLEHGTTLQGLMLHHKIDPDDFLEKAHAIDYTGLLPQP